MPIVLKPFRKAVAISDETLSSLPEEVRDAVKNEKSDRKRMKVLLQFLYGKLRSYWKVAETLGLSPITTYYWMLTLGVPVRERETPKRRRLAKLKNIDDFEKVRMWTIIYCDGAIQRCGRRLKVQIGTPGPWLLHMFSEIFKPHAEVKVNSRIDSYGSPKWEAGCYLPCEGCSWLLKKDLQSYGEIFSRRCWQY